MPAHESAGVLEVDLAALERNYRQLQERATGAEVAAVVKADAYGLGAVPIARRLTEAGCRTFFVATLGEALALRAVLETPAILVFEGIAAGREHVFVEHRLTPVLNTPDQADRWSRVDAPAALHLDTGMSRLGLSPAELRRLVAAGFDFSGLRLVLLVTHLACAGEATETADARNRAQLEAFSELRALLPAVRVSIANSAGIFLGEPFRGDLVRAGIALYGGNPLDADANPMEVVASLKARVLQLRVVDGPSSVGYGATYSAGAGDRLAVVGVGYADGFPRQLGNRGVASVGGVRVPIVGRVSMDLLCLDVSALPAEAVTVGDYVELFGRDIPVEEVAGLCGTISYEILSGMSRRLERSYSS